ncbi:hypothetical protein HID58_069432, partial [Brassica napus]
MVRTLFIHCGGPASVGIHGTTSSRDDKNSRWSKRLETEKIGIEGTFISVVLKRHKQSSAVDLHLEFISRHQSIGVLLNHATTSHNQSSTINFAPSPPVSYAKSFMSFMSSHKCYTKSNQISSGFVITNASSQVSVRGVYSSSCKEK